MQPIVMFPDVEAWAVSFLRDALAEREEPYAQGVFVATNVPTERRDRMAIVRRDGGTRRTVVTETARLGVRVFGGSEEEASDLTTLVRALLMASPGEGPVRRYAEIAGPARLIEESGQPLRYFSAELTVRSI